MRPSLLFSVFFSISLLFLLLLVALKLRSLRFHSPRLCRIAVFLIQTNVSLFELEYLGVVLLEIHTCCIHYRPSTRMIRSITSAAGPSSCMRLEDASKCVYHGCRRESCEPSPLMALDQYCHFSEPFFLLFPGTGTSSPHPDCSSVFPYLDHQPLEVWMHFPREEYSFGD